MRGLIGQWVRCTGFPTNAWDHLRGLEGVVEDVSTVGIHGQLKVRVRGGFTYRGAFYEFMWLDEGEFEAIPASRVIRRSASGRPAGRISHQPRQV